MNLLVDVEVPQNRWFWQPENSAWTGHYFEFNEKDSGEFHFGYVHGHMDCRLTTRDGEPAVEWSWDGNDEMDPAQGRGWAVIRDGELHGMIFFHGGDDSEFVARKKGVTRPKASKRKR